MILSNKGISNDNQCGKNCFKNEILLLQVTYDLSCLLIIWTAPAVIQTVLLTFLSSPPNVLEFGNKRMTNIDTPAIITWINKAISSNLSLPSNLSLLLHHQTTTLSPLWLIYLRGYHCTYIIKPHLSKPESQYDTIYSRDLPKVK